MKTDIETAIELLTERKGRWNKIADKIEFKGELGEYDQPTEEFVQAIIDWEPSPEALMEHFLSQDPVNWDAITYLLNMHPDKHAAFASLLTKFGHKNEASIARAVAMGVPLSFEIE